MNIELIGFISASATSVVLASLRIVEKRKNGKPDPGFAPVCESNKTSITELKVTGKFVAKEIASINVAIGNIWGKLNGD